MAFFATQLYPLAVGRSSGFGGAETELWNVAQGLGRAVDLDVRVLTLTDEVREARRFGNVELYPVAPAEKLTFDDPVVKRRMAIVKYYVTLLRELKRQKADVYFSKLASSEASAVWLAARAARGKFVFRVEHDWETNQRDLTEIIFRGSKFWADRFVFCLKRADLVVAQTERQRDELNRNYGVESVLIPNGHSMPADAEVEAVPERRTKVLWVGRDHAMKRPQLFLDLAEKHPDISFEMIMATASENGELLAECRRRAETLPNVEFLPGAAPGELNRHYQRARVFVLTSEAEGFSNVIIEALKNGTPVVALGHNPNDMLAAMDGGNASAAAAGYYTAGDMAATSAIIGRMFEDAGFWTACHRRARAVAVETFGIDNVVARYREEFERLLRRQ